jgi:hypothetical protein
MCKDEIEYRFLRGYDETRIDADSKKFLLRSSDIADPSFVQRIGLMIQKVNGKELTSQQKFLYAKKLTAGDVADLNDDCDYNESGVQLLLETECTKCGYIEEVGMPFTADFFRPKPRKSRRRR